MDYKPIITYFGSNDTFRTLEAHIVSAIPRDVCEWRRNYGRAIKNIKLEAIFQEFTIDLLEKYKKGEWSIQKHPLLHVFVTDCNDVETYKASVKYDIENWLKTLHSYGINDWMILLVEAFDVKKTKNLLPRTTVLDKIRFDFAPKNGDRCISVLNPAKHEQKSTESFRCLIQRIRYLMLTSYTKNIVKYEELIRSHREKRNQENWCFIKYFLLQEELALTFEKLQLHSEALVQYDELDAMLSQFITNSVIGERPKWLESFKKPISTFNGICLKRKNKLLNRDKIINKSITFLELRNYIYERQCSILHFCDRPIEIGERLLPFLFSTLREIEALKIESPIGALACWEFICAVEVLDICDEVMEKRNIACFQYTAPIWNLAKDKLYQLGKICGLLPGFSPTSEQLHIVVQLSAGVGDEIPESSFLDAITNTNKRSHSPHRKPKKCATEQLKLGLGSTEGFQQLFLELCELAISTYKHVSHLRCARLVGLDLGNFYCTLNEPQKAIVFFNDLLRELKTENWNFLVSQTLLELCTCYKKMNDLLAYTKTCAAISCCLQIEKLVRTFYFDEFVKSLKEIDLDSITIENEQNCFAVLEDHFEIIDLRLLNEGEIVQDDIIRLQLKIKSNFPREILISRIRFSYEIESCSSEQLAQTVASLSIFQTTPSPFIIQLDYKQDNTLSCASVALETKKTISSIRRTSVTRRKISPTVRSDFTNCFMMENVNIYSGNNIIEITGKATRVGSWSLRQLSLEVQKIEFLSNRIPKKLVTFDIITKAASAVLNFKNLVAGLEQQVRLIISGGSFIYAADSKIILNCSKNLNIRVLDNENSTFDSNAIIFLKNFKSFEEREIDLEVLADLPGRNVDKHIEHMIKLTCPWSRNEIRIPLNFVPAITSSCRLHTCGTRKFLQVCIKGLDAQLLLINATMKCDSVGVTLIDLNRKSQNKTQIYKNLVVSYLWALQVEPLKAENELTVMKVNFTVQYANYKMQNNTRTYACTFDVIDYRTLFEIHSHIEPLELCRVRTVCGLNLKITKVQDSPFNDLMYEVLADQNMWAVCGRTAGVISMKGVESHSISLEVMPLCAGFLPLPNIKLSKYISAERGKQDVHSKLQAFPPGQIYNSTKSCQIHVLAGTNQETA